MKFIQAINLFTEFSKAGNARSPNSILGYEMDLKRLCLHLHNPPILSVTDEHIVEYLRDMEDLGWKKNSMVAKITAFKKFFQYLRVKGFPVLNPSLIPSIHKEFKMPKIATVDDIRRVMEKLPRNSSNSLIARNRAMIQFLADTGVRNSEMASVDLSDVNGTHSCLIRTKKAQKGIKPIRKVFWSKETNDDIFHWMNIRDRLEKKHTFKDPEALFVGARGWQVGKRLTNSGVCIALRKVSKSAGLERSMNPHSLRHKFGRDLSKNGANNSIISSLLGHVSMNSSYIYTMLEGKDLEETYRKYKGGI